MSSVKKEKYPIPEDGIAGQWFISADNGTHCIRRKIKLPDKVMYQRANRSDYERYLTAYSERELDFYAKNPGEEHKLPRAFEDYVVRLNGKDPEAERIKKLVQYNHSWINDDFLQAYKQEILYTSMQDRKNADTLFNYLTRYALNWFLTKKKALTVQSWKHFEKEWGMYLLNLPDDQGRMEDSLRIFSDEADDHNLKPKDRQLSAKVLKYVMFEINRFIRYVYSKRLSEFDNQLVQLEPWGKDYLGGYASNWKVKYKARLSKYIKDEDWKVISKAMLDSKVIWRHEVHLAREYGLRRRETLCLDLLAVKPEHLLLQQQLDRAQLIDGRQVKIPKGLKGQEIERRIPHWFVEEPKVTRARIKAILSENIPHPDTISKGFREFCKALKDKDGKPYGFDFIFHDLRRTFITNAVKKGIKIEDLIFATGHKNEQVLRKYYLMDYRELDQDFDLGEDDEEIVV